MPAVLTDLTVIERSGVLYKAPLSQLVALAGGGGGSQQVFVQQTRPVTAGPWLWVQIDAENNPIDLIANDGAP